MVRKKGSLQFNFVRCTSPWAYMEWRETNRGKNLLRSCFTNLACGFGFASMIIFLTG